VDTALRAFAHPTPEHLAHRARSPASQQEVSMADQDPMPRANATVWQGLSLAGALFLAGFMAWAAIFGFGGTSPNQQQQASRAPQTTQAPQTTGQGQAAPHAQPAQQQGQQQK
jgi:hypothetical protein